jgi:hypothetical protein
MHQRSAARHRHCRRGLCAEHRITPCLSGLGAFSDEFTPARTVLVGADGVPVEEFLATPVGHWLKP